MFHLPKTEALFPTFSSFVSGHKKLTLAIFSLYFATIILAVSLIALANRQITSTGGIDGTGVSIPLLTAYGSQRHVFTKQDGSLVAVWANADKQVVAAISSDGSNWQNLPSPLFEGAENVSGALDRGDSLHLAYESQGKIFYRVVSKDGSVSNAVPIDISGLAHRPSLILESSSDLPAVAWSSESRIGRIRQSRIGFMKAKSESSDLKNWCNAKGDSCGLPAYISVSGSADLLGLFFVRATLHPVLAQMPISGDFYLFWSDNSRKGSETLKLAVAKKESEGWGWENAQVVGEVGEETAKKFTLSAASDNSQVVVAYVGKDNNTKLVAYKTDGQKSELLTNQNLGSQFSLVSGEGKNFLFYRKSNGKIGLGQYDNALTEVMETAKIGGHPQAAEGILSGKVSFAYTAADGRVEFGSYIPSVPTPTPTATPTLAPEATPAFEPTATSESTESGTPQ